MRSKARCRSTGSPLRAAATADRCVDGNAPLARPIGFLFDIERLETIWLSLYNILAAIHNRTRIYADRIRTTNPKILALLERILA